MESKMRLASLGLLGLLVATPAFAQGYYPYGYGPRPGAWDAAHEHWHEAHHAEQVAQWRAAHGDYYGAQRAEQHAQRERAQAHWDVQAARGY
jgi:hypothetical protein